MRKIPSVQALKMLFSQATWSMIGPFNMLSTSTISERKWSRYTGRNPPSKKESKLLKKYIFSMLHHKVMKRLPPWLPTNGLQEHLKEDSSARMLSILLIHRDNNFWLAVLHQILSTKHLGPLQKVNYKWVTKTCGLWLDFLMEQDDQSSVFDKWYWQDNLEKSTRRCVILIQSLFNYL